MLAYHTKKNMFSDLEGPFEEELKAQAVADPFKFEEENPDWLLLFKEPECDKIKNDLFLQFYLSQYRNGKAKNIIIELAVQFEAFWRQLQKVGYKIERP